MTMPRAEYPHCNSEVLHQPGTCTYCDHYPERQAMRIASHTPFTPAEANGWYGNTARYDTNDPGTRRPPPPPLQPPLDGPSNGPSLRARLRALIGLR